MGSRDVVDDGGGGRSVDLDLGVATGGRDESHQGVGTILARGVCVQQEFEVSFISSRQSRLRELIFFDLRFEQDASILHRGSRETTKERSSSRYR